MNTEHEVIPSPGLPNPGIESQGLCAAVDFYPEPPQEAPFNLLACSNVVLPFCIGMPEKLSTAGGGSPKRESGRVGVAAECLEREAGSEPDVSKHTGDTPLRQKLAEIKFSLSAFDSPEVGLW